MSDLREQRLALLIGILMGQIAELLNYMKSNDANLTRAYDSLFDIHQAAALQVHELFYKSDKL